MGKKFKNTHPPSFEELSVVLGWSKADGIFRNRYYQRAVLNNNGEEINQFKPASSIREAAVMLKTNSYQIRRMIKLAKNGGKKGLETAVWG